MQGQFQPLAFQDLKKLRRAFRKIISRASSLPMNLQRIIGRIDSRAGPTISFIIQQARLLNKSWRNFGLIQRIKSWQIRGGTKKLSKL